MKNFNSKIYHGRVFHQRHQPKKHSLSYRVCSFLLDLEELSTLDKQLRYFSYNKFNILSFWDKDFGDKDTRHTRGYAERTLQDAGIDIGGGSIRLLCYPRIFGFAFNPLSVYFCYNQNKELQAIIYEVSNTFGQRHSYLIKTDDHHENVIKHSCDKEFYVSPFIDMDATYHFTITPPKDVVSVNINQTNSIGPLLTACFNGKAQNISDRHCLGVIFKYPLMTLKVVAGIHWEAFKLWRKGIKIVNRPSPPEKNITTEHNVTFQESGAK